LSAASRRPVASVPIPLVANMRPNKQWRRQKEEVGWALACVRQPNAEGVRSEAPRGRGAAGAETSAEGARVEAASTLDVANLLQSRLVKKF